MQTNYTNEETNIIISNAFNDAVVMHIAKRIANAQVNGSIEERNEATNDYKQHTYHMSDAERKMFDGLILDFVWNLTAQVAKSE